MFFPKRLFALFLVLMCSAGYAIDPTTYIPQNAKTYIPIVKAEQAKYFSDLSYPEYLPGLIEQESCIFLTDKRCWSPNSKLSTSRELGVGVFQLTKAFKADGSTRFDALKDLRNQHMTELADLNWSDIESRIDLQMRAGILMSRDNYKKLFMVTNPYERLAMADSAYNGGLGGLLKERRYCGLTSNCDPQKWFGNIERTCLKSKRPLYGNRSACDINREHVSNIFKIRMKKYKQFYQ